MSAIENKGHITIDGFLFVLARLPRAIRHIYGRQEAPSFVNKFSSGDPNYRDASFYPHFVQNNYLNGFDQEKFNDGGKFFRSSNIDPTKQEKLKLQKAVASVGSITGDVECFGLRSSSSQGWWNTNYGYRQKLNIAAPLTQAIPVGYPVKVTIDTAALETAVKVRSDRKDWRIIYVNGSTTTDLTRDYIATTTTFFAIQAAISAGQTSGDYYVYYGYSSESTTKQPSTEAEFNAVYGMYGTTADSNSKAVYHFREGTGTSVADDSTNANTGTLTGSPAWVTNARLGRAVDFDGSNDRMTNANLALGSFTMEGWFNFDDVTTTQFLSSQEDQAGGTETYKFYVSAGVLGFGQKGYSDLTSGVNTLVVGTDYHLAVTNDGTTVRLWINGAQVGSQVNGALEASTKDYNIGVKYAGSYQGYMNGRLNHFRFSDTARSSFPYAFATEPTVTADNEIAQAAIPAGGIFEIYAGSSNGLIYLFDGNNSWAEVFNTRRMKWFDTVASKDADKVVGDTGGTETAQAQSFQIDASRRIKAVEVYIKKAAGTPSDLQVRIETNNAGVPSGTLVDAALSLTSPVAGFSSSYGFVTFEFASPVSLNSGTTYWIVLKTAAAANDQNYNVGADASSPSYTGGTAAHSTDGGTTWSADSGIDLLFRILGETTSVNQIVQATFSSTTKIYFATGDASNTNGGGACIFSYDGTTWALAKNFTGVGTGAALCMQVYGSATSKLYVGLAPTAQIYSSSDGTTFTLSKDIDEPNNPGYVWDMEVYNGRLYACGGHPEFVLTSNSQGFLYSFDEFTWNIVHNFGFTVAKSLCVYDSLLFVGTINKNLFVYNTSSMDKLLEFPWDVSIDEMTVHDDKLALALNATNSLTGQEGIYLFDRNGFHRAFTPAAIGYKALLSARNLLLIGGTSTTIYQTSSNTYVSSGTVQLSYFEASLPNIDKLFRDVTLQYEALPAGCSILVQYKTDESDASWTTIGTADNVDSTQETFTFPVAIYAKKMSFLLTLTTSDNTVTPVHKIIDVRYVLAPDFKYLWKMTLACPDNIEWLDGTRPISVTAEAISADEAAIDLADASGFPLKGRGVVVDAGVEDEFYWTGISGNTLTGCVGLTAHASTGLTVKITGKTMHKQLLTLKQAKTFYTFVDVDGLSYTVAFNNYQEDGFAIDQSGGIENNVPITLLEA